MPVSPDNFKFIQQFAREAAALVIEPGKEYLIETRLTGMSKQAGFATLDDFLTQLRTNRTATLFHEQVIDALTTNETSFFRDFHPFETLREHILPRLIEQRAGLRRLAIWSAASSTGQEAYSIGILIREHFPQIRDWNVTILGTDLSPTVLAQARQGQYSQLEVNRGMPAPLLLRHFTKVGTKWEVKEDVKRMVEFRQMNLFKPWPILPMFDIVFIRNVMIYFDVETKRTILKRIRQCLQPQGSLFLGAAESTMNIDPAWTCVSLGKSTVYQSTPALAAVA
ncbi:MAG TPA: chemotaxis protein CheR [Verrucomicrobiales bacterium]|nr:chemotaxis protein CheR [Verrucomicrobiales bacterium]